MGEPTEQQGASATSQPTEPTPRPSDEFPSIAKTTQAAEGMKTAEERYRTGVADSVAQGGQEPVDVTAAKAGQALAYHDFIPTTHTGEAAKGRLTETPENNFTAPQNTVETAVAQLTHDNVRRWDQAIKDGAADETPVEINAVVESAVVRDTELMADVFEKYPGIGDLAPKDMLAVVGKMEVLDRAVRNYEPEMERWTAIEQRLEAFPEDCRGPLNKAAYLSNLIVGMTNSEDLKHADPNWIHNTYIVADKSLPSEYMLRYKITPEEFSLWGELKADSGFMREIDSNRELGLYLHTKIAPIDSVDEARKTILSLVQDIHAKRLEIPRALQAQKEELGRPYAHQAERVPSFFTDVKTPDPQTVQPKPENPFANVPITPIQPDEHMDDDHDGIVRGYN